MNTFVIKVLSVFTFFPFFLFTSCEDDDPVSDPTVTTVTVFKIIWKYNSFILLFRIDFKLI